MRKFLAIDMGASGGRHILGWIEDGKLQIEEVHRFPNGMKQMGGSLCWDADAMFDEVMTGLKKCAKIGKIPVSVGVDTWGVDYVFIDKNGDRVGPAMAYRDSYTDGMDIEVYKHISEAELYQRTGIQKMLINTIYQLMAVKTKTPQYLQEAEHMLFTPDYLHYRLCGIAKNEYTIASTGGLLDVRNKTWDEEIINRCGFPRKIFGEIVPGGTILGKFTEQIKSDAGFDCTVVMPPSHDTACAFLAVPAKSDRSVYISSGTWSLMGVELPEPICTETGRVANITNEGGYEYRYRFLKNIMGLWILQSVHKEIGDGISYSKLVDLTKESSYDGVFDVDETRFIAPKSMVDVVKDACKERGQIEPKSLGDFARSICRSLAVSYAKTVKKISAETGTEYDSINIIGGGSQNGFLNEVTSAACGLPVYAGPVEGTALGNIASQMIAFGELSGLEEARKLIRKSFEINEVRA